MAEPLTYDGGRIREPSLDTQSYEAVRIVPKKELERLPNLGTTIFYIAKGEQKPHVISCGIKASQESAPQAPYVRREPGS